MERRSFSSAPSVEGRTAVGYAAVFNSPTAIGDFMEQVAPGAFTRSLADDEQLAFYNHQRGDVLGRTSNGTLRLSEDAHGLRFEIDLPDTTLGRDVAALLARGDVKGASFGFTIEDQEWTRDEGVPLRTLRSVRLYEVSLTPSPAYADTTASLRAADLGAPSTIRPRIVLVRARLIGL